MHTSTASLKSVGMTCVLGYPCKPWWGCRMWGFIWLFLLWEKHWESGEEQGRSGNTSLRLLERSQRGGFSFVGQRLISAEWTGNLAPVSVLLGNVTALTCSWPLGKCPFALVLLKDRDQWLVCSLSFCHPAQMSLLNREGFAVAGCRCCGESRGSIRWKCLLHVKTHLIQSNSDLLVLAQAPCHRKERQRSSDRM